MNTKAEWKELRKDLARFDIAFYLALAAALAVTFHKELPTWVGETARQTLVIMLAMITQHFVGKRFVGDVDWTVCWPWPLAGAARLLILGMALYAAARFI